MSNKYECHITVEDNLEVFEESCKEIGAKPIIIKLDSGETPTQVMTAKKFNDSNYLESIIHDVFKLQKHHRIKRIKIESRLDIHSPALYYEAHIKCVQDTLSQLNDEHLARCKAKLSNNSFDEKHRFVNIRGTNLDEFQERLNLLIFFLYKNGVKFTKISEESVLLDTDSSIDKGWIEIGDEDANASPAV